MKEPSGAVSNRDICIVPKVNAVVNCKIPKCVCILPVIKSKAEEVWSCQI